MRRERIDKPFDAAIGSPSSDHAHGPGILNLRYPSATSSQTSRVETQCTRENPSTSDREPVKSYLRTLPAKRDPARGAPPPTHAPLTICVGVVTEPPTHRRCWWSGPRCWRSHRRRRRRAWRRRRHRRPVKDEGKQRSDVSTDAS